MGKELVIIVDEFIISDPISKLLLVELGNKEYEYTETETQIIINL